MDPETFEQAMIPATILGDQLPFLQDNMKVDVDLVEGEPVGIHLPSTVILDRRGSRPGREGPDRRQLLQARQAVQRRQDPGAAVHQRGERSS